MLLQGKKGVVLGVANRRSLAWFIASQARAHGAELVLGVANERFRDRSVPLAEELGAPAPVICDVSSDESIRTCFEQVREVHPQIDFLVHSIAYADRADLEGRFVKTSRAGYHRAQDVSAYSLTAVAREAEAMLAPAASILTLSYLGAVRAVPSYNVMGVAKAALEASVRYLACDLGPRGVRVNALSAGPLRTLSSSAVKGLQTKIDLQAAITPMRRSICGEDVGNAAVFLLSELAAGVTGETLYVDNGYHILGAYPQEV